MGDAPVGCVRLNSVHSLTDLVHEEAQVTSLHLEGWVGNKDGCVREMSVEGR